MTTYEEVLQSFRYGVVAQDALYDKYVTPALNDGSQDDIVNGYAEYRKAVGTFDIRAFRNCVQYYHQHKDEEPEVFENLAHLFSYVPEYIEQRGLFNKRTKEINEMDGTPLERKSMWETLDRNRTRAHNGVIALFNTLNKFAVDRGIAQPYPTDHEFDKNDPKDRNHVAEILESHEPLLDTVNQFMQETTSLQYSVESIRVMGIKELLEYAQSKLKSDTPALGGV